MTTILKSKLRPPVERWAVVERATMLLRLDVAVADPAVQVVLLTAAGYSKTTVLAEHYAAHAAWDAAIPHWQAILALAPAREEIHARLMTVYSRLGRRDAALAQFQAARAALAAAYGTPPGAALADLHAQLLGRASDQ